MKPIFQKPAKTYSNATQFLADNNELLKKNKNRDLYGNDAGGNAALYVDTSPRLPAAYSESMTPKATEQSDDNNPINYLERYAMDPISTDAAYGIRPSIYSQELIDVLTNLDPDKLTNTQRSLLDNLFLYQKYLENQGGDNVPHNDGENGGGAGGNGGGDTSSTNTTTDTNNNGDNSNDNKTHPASSIPANGHGINSLLANAVLSAGALTNNEKTIGYADDLNKLGDEYVQNLSKYRDATEAESGGYQSVLKAQQNIADFFDQTKKELQDQLNSPKVKVGSLTPNQQRNFLADKAEQLEMGGDDPMSGQNPAQMEGFGLSVDPTGSITYKRQEPTFREGLGETIDKVGTAINAPELNISELIAGRKTANSNRKSLFATPKSIDTQSSGSVLGASIASALSPKPVYATSGEQEMPDMSMVGSGGSSGSPSAAPAATPIRTSGGGSNTPTTSKNNVQTSNKAPVATSAIVQSKMPASTAKTSSAMSVQANANMSPATLQSKATPASVTTPAPAKQSNMVTAAVNALKSLFKL